MTSPMSLGRILVDVPCKVCRDHSSGKHYGIYACDGCAGFFKRSIRRNRQYVCKSRQGSCPVDKTHRNQCRACRLRKCTDSGMNKDAVQHERGPRNSTIRRQVALYLKERQSQVAAAAAAAVVSGTSGHHHVHALHQPHHQSHHQPHPPHNHGQQSQHSMSSLTAGEGRDLDLEEDVLVRSVSDHYRATAAAMASFGTLPNIGKLEPSTAIVGDNHAQLPMSAGMHLSAELHQHHNHRHNHRHNNNNTIERDVENTSPLLFQPHLNKYPKDFKSQRIKLPVNSAVFPHVTPPPIQHVTPPPPPPGYGPPPSSSSPYHHQVALREQEICELAARILFMGVKWAKCVPSFVSLPHPDQVLLLQAGWRELFVLGAAQCRMRPMDIASLLSCSGNCDPEVYKDMSTLNEIITRFSDLQVDITEYACLRGIVIFKTGLDQETSSENRYSPSSSGSQPRGIDTPPPPPPSRRTPSPGRRAALIDATTVSRLQDQAQHTLNSYVKSSEATPYKHYRLGSLLLTLPTLKSVSSRSIEEVFFRKTIGNTTIERLLLDMYTSTDI